MIFLTNKKTSLKLICPECLWRLHAAGHNPSAKPKAIINKKFSALQTDVSLIYFYLIISHDFISTIALRKCNTRVADETY